jgi:hypothetical protein
VKEISQLGDIGNERRAHQAKEKDIRSGILAGIRVVRDGQGAGAYPVDPEHSENSPASQKSGDLISPPDRPP